MRGGRGRRNSLRFDENPELSKVPSFTPKVGQNTASPAAGNSAFKADQVSHLSRTLLFTHEAKGDVDHARFIAFTYCLMNQMRHLTMTFALELSGAGRQVNLITVC